MSSCSDLTVTSATGAGGSNRAASYTGIAVLPNFQHEVGGILRMRELRRANLRRRRYRGNTCFVFDTQMNAGPLGKFERLNRSECALAEDGVDLTDHGRI